ncbi:uncharacterized protein LY89DRAFT_681932 [Mollisia scopiformis]|uniref:Uncharacterized protein n=1 Tax=Mollisia scopiformis TaxID=149040 RepID=A0A194XMS3_MOLSC|nr:uncharacterized protein LY89DRAFT_681932 [Mollisia scopiformis]KUJ21426.1 hypothetical protein LY89DRAFT_681932 [Mollisia scopiformis]
MTSLDGEEECNSEDAFPTLDWHVNSDHGEPPLTFDSSTTFPSPSLESSCNPFEESFRNAQHWETWDRDSISTASFQGNVPNVSNDLHYATDLYSMITTTPAEGENPFHYTLGRTSPEYNNTTTSDFVYPAMTTSPLSTTSFMGYNTGEQIDINKSYTDHTTKVNTQMRHHKEKLTELPATVDSNKFFQNKA